MFRNALVASVIALGAAGVAQAQDAGPRLVGGGDNAELVHHQAMPSDSMLAGRPAQPGG